MSPTTKKKCSTNPKSNSSCFAVERLWVYLEYKSRIMKRLQAATRTYTAPNSHSKALYKGLFDCSYVFLKHIRVCALFNKIYKNNLIDIFQPIQKNVAVKPPLLYHPWMLEIKSQNCFGLLTLRLMCMCGSVEDHSPCQRNSEVILPNIYEPRMNCNVSQPLPNLKNETQRKRNVTFLWLWPNVRQVDN